MSSNDLIDWHEHWQLCKAFAVCRGCGATQHETEREQTFSHEEGCSQGKQVHPWDTLDSAIVVLQG